MMSIPFSNCAKNFKFYYAIFIRSKFNAALFIQTCVKNAGNCVTNLYFGALKVWICFERKRER